MQRRQLLQSLAALGIAVSPATHALGTIRDGVDDALGRDGRSHLDDWEETVAEYGYAYLAVPPQRLVAELASDLVALQSRMAGVGAQAPAYRSWCRVSGALSLLMAKTVGNLGEGQQARQWWSTAQHAADSSGDLELRLWVRGERVIHGLYEHRPPQLLLRRAAEATELAGGHPCRGLATASAGRAQALALAGRDREAAEELRRTEAVLEQLPAAVTGDNGSINNWAEDSLRYTQTWVHAHAGDEAEADAAARRTLQLYPDSYRRGPVQIGLMQAFTRVRAGDVTEGIRHAQGVYEPLPPEHRTVMVTDLASRVLDGVPPGQRDRADVATYRELLAEPAPSPPTSTA